MVPVGRVKHMDVTNSVDVSDRSAVNAAVRDIVDRLYPSFDFSPIDLLFKDFGRLYEGKFPGFRACDINYHNEQHVLDVTLAMTRLMDGHEKRQPAADRLGAEFVLKGVAAALFHDSGYIRRTRDSRHKNGAAYTHIHVSRSARFMGEYFPEVGLGHLVPTCSRIVHFTSYLLDPVEIEVACERERRLGELLGTADLIAQMADVEYLAKLYKHLYAEFEAGGMAGKDAFRTHTGVIYDSPDHLLQLTPEFIRNSIDRRLEGYFGGALHYATAHFNGPNLYLEAIHDNCRKLETMLAASE